MNTMRASNTYTEDDITNAVHEAIELFDYYLNKASHQEKPAIKIYVSESQEDAIRDIASSARVHN